MDKGRMEFKGQKISPQGGNRSNNGGSDTGQVEYMTRLTSLRDNLVKQEQMSLAKAIDRLRMHSQANKTSSNRQRANLPELNKSSAASARPTMMTTVEKFRQMRPREPKPDIHPVVGRQLLVGHESSGELIVSLGSPGQGRGGDRSGGCTAHAAAAASSKANDLVDSNLMRLSQTTCGGAPNTGRASGDSSERKGKAIQRLKSFIHRQKVRKWLPFENVQTPNSPGPHQAAREVPMRNQQRDESVRVTFPVVYSCEILSQGVYYTGKDNDDDRYDDQSNKDPTISNVFKRCQGRGGSMKVESTRERNRGGYTDQMETISKLKSQNQQRVLYTQANLKNRNDVEVMNNVVYNADRCSNNLDLRSINRGYNSGLILQPIDQGYHNSPVLQPIDKGYHNSPVLQTADRGYHTNPVLQPLDQGYLNNPQTIDQGYQNSPQTIDKGYHSSPQHVDKGYQNSPQTIDKSYHSSPQHVDKGYQNSPQIIDKVYRNNSPSPTSQPMGGEYQNTSSPAVQNPQQKTAAADGRGTEFIGGVMELLPNRSYRASIRNGVVYVHGIEDDAEEGAPGVAETPVSAVVNPEPEGKGNQAAPRDCGQSVQAAEVETTDNNAAAGVTQGREKRQGPGNEGLQAIGQGLEVSKMHRKHIVVDMPEITFNAASPAQEADDSTDGEHDDDDDDDDDDEEDGSEEDGSEEEESEEEESDQDDKGEDDNQQDDDGRDDNEDNDGPRGATAGESPLRAAVEHQQQVRLRELTSLLEDVRELSLKTEALKLQSAT